VAATRVIEIRTEIPGPRSREILERERHAVAAPLIVHEPVVADRARGSTITDVDGNTFVDFVGGVGVANVGHNHPRVVAAIVEQAERFLHTDFTVVPYEGYVDLAERLGVLAPISGETRCAFFNSIRFFTVHFCPAVVGTDEPVPATPLSVNVVPVVVQYCVSEPALRP